MTTISGVVGTVVVSAQQSRNVVHHHDLRTGREWESEIGSPIYRAPVWPKKRMASPDEAIRWADRQMWVSKLVPLDSTHYAMQFGTYGANRERVFRYAVARTDGTTVAVTDTTRYDLKLTREGRVYASRMDDEGNFELATFRARVPEKRGDIR